MFSCQIVPFNWFLKELLENYNSPISFQVGTNIYCKSECKFKIVDICTYIG